MADFVWIGHFRGYSGFAKATREYFKAILPYFDNLKLASLESLSEDDPFHKYRANLPLSDREIKIVNHLPTTDPTAKVYLSVWEFDHIPEEWVEIFNQAEIIMTQSTFCRDVFAHQIDDPSKIYITPYIVPKNFSPIGSRKRYYSAEIFVFGSVFDWVPRKVPDRMIEAFQKEFCNDEPVRLVLRTNYPHYSRKIETQKIRKIIEEDSRIRIIEEKIPDIAEFYRGLDVYVSATAGEGWGQTLTEAMVCGIPTIASRHSGNLDFMNDENSFLVDVHDWSPISENSEYKWKLPKINSIRTRMRDLFELWCSNGGDLSKISQVQKAMELRDILTSEKIGKKIAKIILSHFD